MLHQLQATATATATATVIAFVVANAGVKKLQKKRTKQIN
jgi:hypothetical protein